MLRRLFSPAIIFVLAFGAILNSANATNVLVPHQGRLLDADDTPITGVRNVTYSIYEVPTGGAPLWSEMHPGVSIQAGLFDAMLGTITPLPSDVFRAPGSGGGGGGGFATRYLEVSVDGVVLSPRLRFGSVPSASVASGVSGDFESSPGQVSMGDTGSDYYATFGEKVNQGLHAAGSALASGASKITNDCDDEDATQQISRNSASGDVAEVVTMCDTAGTSLKMKVDGLMGARMSTNMTIGKQSGRFSMGADSDQDDVPESEIENFVAPGTCSVAIKTRGTGADKNRVIGSSCDDSLSINYLDIDDDGDGISEAKAVSAVSTLAGGGGGGGGAAAASYARWYTDSDDDGVPEGDISQMVTPGTCSVAIKTRGTGADKNRSIGSSTDDSSAVQVLELDDDGDGIVEGRGIISVKSASGTGSMSASGRLTCDPDEDGDPEGDISQFVTPGTCSVAIKTKGTGADKNRVISSTCDDSTARQVIGIDDDGDGVPDNGIEQAASDENFRYAIKHKRTSNGQSGAASGTVSPDSVVTRSGVDMSGDGNPESEISQSVLPGNCSVAIKTKGTGADKNRTIGSSCDDSSAIQVLELDDDGDGIVEGRGIISVKSGTGSGSMSASSRLTCDPDEDGDQESTVESSCDANSAKIIVDRESGRSKGFMRAIDTGSSVTLENDLNNDGLVDRSVVSSIDSEQAEVVASEGSTQVSMKVRKGGVVKGNININNGGALRVDLDGDGNGYLSNSLGVGVTATHHIDVAGGAYCDGTNWVNASDKNSKENFQSVDGQELLDKIADLSITEWNYKADKNARHIGPTAQDFKDKFGVGSDGKSISTIDPSGIALAAIQELYSQLKQKDEALSTQAKLIEELQKRLAGIERELKKK